MIVRPRVGGKTLFTAVTSPTFGQWGVGPCLDLPLCNTYIIAMASVDKVDVVVRLTSSIHHDHEVMLRLNGKTAHHIGHTINSCSGIMGGEKGWTTPGGNQEGRQNGKMWVIMAKKWGDKGISVFFGGGGREIGWLS